MLVADYARVVSQPSRQLMKMLVIVTVPLAFGLTASDANIGILGSAATFCVEAANQESE